MLVVAIPKIKMTKKVPRRGYIVTIWPLDTKERFNSPARKSITGSGLILRSVKDARLKRIEAIPGITVTETMTEIITDTDIAMPMSRNSWPTGISRIITGIKTYS